MPITVTQAQGSKGLGRNVARAVAGRLPGAAAEVIVLCGEVAQLPLNIAHDMAGEFSGYKGKNYVGDMVMKGSIKVAKATAETTTKLSISAVRNVSRSITGR